MYKEMCMCICVYVYRPTSAQGNWEHKSMSAKNEERESAKAKA